jgi:putative transposase
MDPLLPFHLFDRDAEIQIVDRRLPHWSQAGAICFITWRTHDSMPESVLQKWHEDRSRWLRQNGVDPAAPNWRNRVAQLGPALEHEFRSTFWNRWQDALDDGHGTCVLRRPELANIIANSMRHFDGERYFMMDFVVMPNHVHLLASFPDEAAMLVQCESWKHYTAARINRQINRKGRFWQQDSFDHLIRSEVQFKYVREYIALNPQKAGLKPGEFVHYSAVLR